MSKLKILFYDVETAPKLGYVCDLWNQNLGLSQIKEDGFILSWSAKWLHSDKIMSDSLNNYGNKMKNQGRMMKKLWKLFEEADVLVGYNSDKFDKRHVNTAFLLAGLTPPPPSKSIDLFKVVKSNFKFTSNKLDFVLGKLGLNQKMSHAGFELWVGCMEGDKESWNTMVEYNKQDVAVTEALYFKLLPWIKNHPSHAHSTDQVSDNPTCNNCGSDKVKKNGMEQLKVTRYQRYKCTSCGNNMRGKALTNTKEKRDSVLVNI